MTAVPADAPGNEQHQVERLRGIRLSRFSLTIHNIELALWADPPNDVSWTIIIEKTSVEVAAGGQPATDYPATDPAVATFLLSALNHEVTHVALGGGRLHIAFGDAGQISVAPDPNFESWNIRSSDHLLIVCQPGGQLATWAANTSP